MNATKTHQPVKGMKFRHAVRKDWKGDPIVGTVSSVSKAKGLVYWVDPLWPDRRMKTPVAAWDRYCAEVISVPEPKAKATYTGPKMMGQCAELHQQAHAAGMAAGEAARPTPMVPVEHADPFDDNSPVKRVYAPVMDGVCGFAWVLVPDGNSPYARYLRDYLNARRGQHGGRMLWVRAFGQSYERKAAYADAYAKTLQEAGVTAYPGGALD